MKLLTFIEVLTEGRTALCQDCVYRTAKGICKRHAPAAALRPVVVAQDNWCGEGLFREPEK